MYHNVGRFYDVKWSVAKVKNETKQFVNFNLVEIIFPEIIVIVRKKQKGGVKFRVHFKLTQ